jgi:hypothetical protein
MKWLVLLIGLLIIGGSPRPIKVVASKRINVYKQPVDRAGDLAFNVKAGDVYFIVDEQRNKVNLFKKIKCNDRVGWTSDWADFRFGYE